MNYIQGNGENTPPSTPDNSYTAETARPQTQIQVQFNGSKPVVVYVILAITVLAYIFQAGSQYLTGVDLGFAMGGKINSLIVAGQYWRLFTPMLLHGSLIHILLNMYALIILGRGLEYNFGRLRFILLYIGAGFAGNVMSFIFSPSPSLGSSTAIFGLLAAEAVFVYQNKKFYGSRAKGILINAATIAGLNLILGLSPGIDNWGHLGGLLGGIIFTWFGGPRWNLKGFMPNFEIEDQHTSSHVWSAFGLTMLVFCAVVLVKLFILK
jgi:rhomboid protease GluP